MTELIKSMQIAKKHIEPKNINSVCVSFDGESVVTASDGDSINLYSCADGGMKRLLHSKKYGCENIKFTHHESQVLYSSSKGSDHAIRYHSLHTNQYIRHFQGHKDRVRCLAVSPTDDFFMSCSDDNTMRFWDLRSPHCCGMMETKGVPIGAFDPEGLIFAVGMDSHVIRLYDLKSYHQGPFSTFQQVPDTSLYWTGLEFSLEGSKILISTNGQHMKIVDAYEGKTKALLGNYQNTAQLPLNAVFSPDGNTVACGTEDGFIHLWESEKGEHIGKLDGRHPNAVSAIAFNHSSDLLVSACSQLCFWLPDEKFD